MVNINGIPIVVIVGVVIVLAIVLAKTWRKLVLAALILGSIVIIAAVGWALLKAQIPADIQETISGIADIVRVLKGDPQPAPVYQAPASSGGFGAGLMTALVIGALGVTVYFGLRWKLAERKALRPANRRQLTMEAQPIVYVIEGQSDNLGDCDLISFEEASEWTAEENFFQF